MKPMRSLPITACTATCALGRGMSSIREAFARGCGGLAPCGFLGQSWSTWTGEIAGLDDAPLTGERAAADCRNNRAATIALDQDDFRARVADAVARYGAARIAVFVGSSTSGLLSTELAYRRRAPDGSLPADLDYAVTHNMYSLARHVRAELALAGPASVTSIACASSARVFAVAARAIEVGIVDAAVVGGVDTLCLTTLHGFGSLELLSPEPCRPYDSRRRGISIGEAAAFALLERETSCGQGMSLGWLAGYGESSDAYHMSSPHPQGAGARMAIERALARAGLPAAGIDYVNLHGTATPSNDRAEDAAVWAVFGDRTPVSSTKGAHGHALGAAGAIEAAVCLSAIAHGYLPGGMNLIERDPTLRCDFRAATEPARLRAVVSNSFGFGGANCALVFTGEALR